MIFTGRRRAGFLMGRMPRYKRFIPFFGEKAKRSIPSVKVMVNPKVGSIVENSVESVDKSSRQAFFGGRFRRGKWKFQSFPGINSYRELNALPTDGRRDMAI